MLLFLIFEESQGQTKMIGETYQVSTGYLIQQAQQSLEPITEEHQISSGEVVSGKIKITYELTD